MYFKLLMSCIIYLSILCIVPTGGQQNFAFNKSTAPDGHRCGVCPTYFQKICAFSFERQSTFIFDNHCVMDLYNCIEGTDFSPFNYEYCLYFGNFAYVHGLKHEDEDYDEANIVIKGVKKNPSFVR